MKFIAHRGCWKGPDKKRENSLELVAEALAQGFDVEVDVHVTSGKVYLGHDGDDYMVEDLSLFSDSRLWCHAKDVQALQKLLLLGVRCFWHEEDRYTLTSDGIIWTYPGQQLTKNSVAVMPEWGKSGVRERTQDDQWMTALAVCTDYAEEYRNAWLVKNPMAENALLLVGEPRTFQQCAPYIKRNIIEPNQCDVFIVPDCKDTMERERVRSQLKEIYKTAYVAFAEDVADNMEFEATTVEHAAGRVGEKADWKLVFQWIKTKLCWELMERNEREVGQGKRYRNVIKTRLDMYIGFPLRTENVPMTDGLCHAWEDFLAFGNRATMNVYCDLAQHYGQYTWNEVNEGVLRYSDKSLEMTSEMQMRRHLADHGVEYNLIHHMKPWMDMAPVRVCKAQCGMMIPSWL